MKGEEVMKQRLSSGSEISYYDSGSGSPIFFVHSYAHNKNMWFPQLEYFLNLGFRVVAPDIPGHGESSFNPKRHTIDHFAQDCEELMSKLNLSKPVFVGISMLGRIEVSSGLFIIAESVASRTSLFTPRFIILI